MVRDSRFVLSNLTWCAPVRNLLLLNKIRTRPPASYSYYRNDHSMERSLSQFRGLSPNLKHDPGASASASRPVVKNPPTVAFLSLREYSIRLTTDRNSLNP
jgi:hypothetical protein